MAKAFRGGVHPHDHKEYAKDAPIMDAPVPDELVVPFVQHMGRPAAAAVKPKDEVKRGQLLAASTGFVSASVHSPVSGRVKKLVTAPHPLGSTCEAALIENDHQDAWAEGVDAERDARAWDADAIRDAIASAGIVGMGGATFPTHVKLSPPDNKPIDTIILNGIECEPFLTADYRLMLESPQTIVGGLRLVMRAVGARRGIVAVEANKPDALAILQKALAEAGGDLESRMLPMQYPQGAEKQLISACLHREVPSGGLPMDVGVVVQNVGTAHAIYEACARSRPLTERVTTVSGPGVERPANFRVRLGTPIRVLLEACGLRTEETRKIVLGGPMMGLAHYDLEVPVNKGTSGILALTHETDAGFQNCIRCGRCVDVCPMGLVPSEYSILAESGRLVDTEAIDILDCMECGACTYACPARRPIVHWIKTCKARIAQARAERENKS